MTLLERIRHEIQARDEKSISFYEYMAMALYYPELGYYNQTKRKIGKQGDFYTSPSVGGVFGEVLAHDLAKRLASIQADRKKHLVEFGGGTGDLMHQILCEWKNSFPELLDEIRVVMIEKSPFHRSLQLDKLAAFGVRWYEDWDSLVHEEGMVTGVVFSNELLDAFPVYMVERQQGEWREVRVGWNERQEKLEERYAPIHQAQLRAYVEYESPYVPREMEYYRMEVNLDAAGWLASLSAGLDQGQIVTIDYGYLRPELYIPERRHGTLMCYRSHTASENPLEAPGYKDMTTHVNFSYVMEEGEKCGLSTVEYSTQSRYLIRSGILERLQDHMETDPFQGTITRRNRAIRQLIMPGGMGDVFKVLIQSKKGTR